MRLPTIVLMPSVNSAYACPGGTYVSNVNGFVFNASATDIPTLTGSYGGVTVAPRNNTSASSNPQNTNDFTQLYGPGSLWENVSTALLWMCTAMGSTPGTATWTAIAATSGALAGDGSAIVVTPSGASTSRTLALLFADAYNNVKTFGAVGNGSTDDTAAINAAITTAGVNGQPVYFPSGTYKVTSQVSVDLHTLSATGQGIWLVGDGMNRSIIDGSATGGFTTLAIFGGSGTPMAQTNCFFGGVRDLGVQGLNNSGAVLTIGTSNFADALNSFDFSNINVKNTSTNSSCVGTSVNYVLDSNFRNLVSNCGQLADGNALVLNQSSFNVFVGGSFSTANIGILITNGFNFANTFLSPDIEVVSQCVRQDSSAQGNGYNTFHGGQFVWNYTPTTYAIYSAALGKLNFHNINFAPNSGTGNPYTGPVLDPSNQIAVQLFGNYGDGTTPASGAPVSGTTYTNATGQAQVVTIYPGTGTTGMSVVINGTQTTADSTNGPVTVVLRPAYTIKVNWATTAVGWVWYPLPV